MCFLFCIAPYFYNFCNDGLMMISKTEICYFSKEINKDVFNWNQKI